MKKYRYFYNDTGYIVGKEMFATECWVLEICGINTYIDSDQDVTSATHKVDVATQSLIALQ